MATTTAGNGATSINSGNIGLAIGGVPTVSPAAPRPLGSHQVTTLVYNGDEVDDDDGGGNTNGGLIVLDDEPFAFVIP
jgi:hypothetical protein